MKRAIWIFWPSFVVAVGAQLLFFALFDQSSLDAIGMPATLSDRAAHTVVFFFVWMAGAASSAFTCFLQRTSGEINGCPFDPARRPRGCPADPVKGSVLKS